jgi:hypothetical protein
MEGRGYGLGVPGGDSEQCQSWPFWVASTLLPIPEGRDTDPDHESKLFLGLTQPGPYRLHILWLKGREACRLQLQPAAPAWEPHLSVLPQPHRDNGWLSVPRRVGNGPNHSTGQDRVCGKLTSDEDGRQLV